MSLFFKIYYLLYKNFEDIIQRFENINYVICDDINDMQEDINNDM
jgi:hypothetical protein